MQIDYSKTWITLFRYISKIKEKFSVPVIAYQVSGEYTLIKNAIDKKFLSESIIESIIFKRAGACAIITYFALEIAKSEINLIIVIF